MVGSGSVYGACGEVGGDGRKAGAVWSRDGCMLVEIDGGGGKPKVGLVDKARGQERGIDGRE